MSNNMSKTKNTLTASALMSACAAILTPIRVSLPEIGGDVFVKRHTLAERDAFNDAIKGLEKTEQNAIGVTLVTCDEQGELIFTPEYAEKVKGLPSSVTNKILYEYNVANGFIIPIDEAVNERRDYEVAQIDFARTKELDAATDHQKTELQLIEQRYKYERQEIELTRNLTNDVRAARIAAINAQEANAAFDLRNSANDAYQSQKAQHVSDATTTRKYRPELESMRNGTYERQSNAPNVNISVTVTMDGNSSVESSSAYGRQIGQGLAAVVASEVSKIMRPNGVMDRRYAKR